LALSLFSKKKSSSATNFKELGFVGNRRNSLQISWQMADLECEESTHVMSDNILSNAVKKKCMDGLPDPHSEAAMEEKYAVSTAARNVPSPPLPLLLLMS
jgi:hypothetical protein